MRISLVLAITVMIPILLAIPINETTEQKKDNLVDYLKNMVAIRRKKGSASHEDNTEGFQRIMDNHDNLVHSLSVEGNALYSQLVTRFVVSEGHFFFSDRESHTISVKEKESKTAAAPKSTAV